MALVGYSDSEESDHETTSVTPTTTSTTKQTGLSKPAFQPLVDTANPHKIRVILPDATTSSSVSYEDQYDVEAPPSKRVKSSSAFSDFNSLLPAPKEVVTPGTLKVAAIHSGRPRGLGLGRGVHLKTGAAPAFIRQMEPEQSYDHSSSHDSEPDPQQAYIKGAEEVGPATERKPVVATMFRPLSVNRKTLKKKKVMAVGAVPAQIVPMEMGRLERRQSLQATSDHLKNEGATRLIVRKSLFAVDEDDLLTPIDEFKDDLETQSLDQHNDRAATQDHTEKSISPITVAQTNGNSLQSLAAQLGLTASQRRQLFGRGGNPTESQITQFSLAAEYQHNNKLMQDQNTAPAHNPVRSIAPGKHSLQQLMNAAANQKDALEESFASGRKNKKDAGSKYGW